MVAAVSHPPTSSAGLELLTRSRNDRALLLKAILAAVVVHLLAFWVPLPAPRERPGVEKTIREPIEVTVITPRPPEITPPAATPRPAPAPSAPLLPVPETVEITPVAEPDRPLDLPAERPATVDTDPIWVEPQPPPLPAVVDVETPGLTAPTAVRQPRPEYPPLARQVRRQGRVLLRAVIGEEGDVREIEVLAAPDPDFGFSAAAIAAVRRWRYEPGTIGGRPVAVSMTVTVEFTLR